jgi:hypothetical protein
MENDMKTYDVLTTTGDGIELWKASLTYDEAQKEIESAQWQFGGKYWMAEAKVNPLHHIPDTTPGPNPNDWR